MLHYAFLFFSCDYYRPTLLVNESTGGDPLCGGSLTFVPKFQVSSRVALSAH
ncbi:MAG: hypothetical protein M5E90_04240 [Asgard group archaeon]|nr:hypothetical protein [Asgard group archaeon]